jgi:hypothetical protein
MKVKIVFVAALLLAVANMMAFGSMKFVKTWKNPEAQPTSWQGKKVAIFIRTLMLNNREPAEKALAGELAQRGIQPVLGYALVPSAVEKDRDAVKRILADAGIAGAVIMHMVGYQDETVVTGGQYLGTNYSTFYGYWNTGMAMGYVPGTVDTKTTVMVESLVYSIDQDKLLWVGTSKVVNPKEVDTVIKKLAGAVGSEVRKAGLVQK